MVGHPVLLWPLLVRGSGTFAGRFGLATYMPSLNSKNGNGWGDGYGGFGGGDGGDFGHGSGDGHGYGHSHGNKHGNGNA